MPDKDLDKLEDLLIHRDPRVRHRATQALKNAGGPSIGSLIIRTRHSSARVRKLALIDLGQRTNLHLAVTAMLDRLKDESSDVAMWAAMRLGDVANPPPSIVPALMDTLHHPSREVRSAAACALGNLGKSASSALPALRRIQDDSDPTVRASVALALGYIGQPAVKNLPP